MKPGAARPLLTFGLVLGGLILLWVAGFAWFVHRATLGAALPARADGIVALTGGAGRVDTALRLLAAGRARVALLSGIGGGAELAELAQRAGVEPAGLAGRVTLGRAATSTHGNATETAGWVGENRVRSLIVVTAGYHMPRALTEMAHALPGVVLYPVPVTPPAMQGPAGMRDAGMLRLMAEEYTKWIAVTVTTGLGLSPIPGDAGVQAHRTRPTGAVL